MTTMTEAERLEFLAGSRVAVVGISRGLPAGPLLAPVWYEYDAANGFRFVTSATSAKSRLLRRNGRATICVQEDGDSYGYVAAEGPVTAQPLDPAETREIMLSMALRYLGPKDGLRFADDFSEPDVQLVTLQPERWASEDLRAIRE